MTRSLLVQQEIHYLYNKKFITCTTRNMQYMLTCTGRLGTPPGRNRKDRDGETKTFTRRATRDIFQISFCVDPWTSQSQRYNCAPHDGSESASRANHWPLARKNRTTSLRPYDRKYTGLWSPGCKTSQRESTSCGVILRQSSCWYRSPFKI
jgi:hypothetical protein